MSSSVDPTFALSPLDGRYVAQTREVARYFAEAALIRYRVLVEVEWLIELAGAGLPGIAPFADDQRALLRSWAEGFSEVDAARVKAIEAKTRHDVKSVEYFLKEKLAAAGLAERRELVHFGCTSEDVNNLAYGLMLKDALANVWLPSAREVVATVRALAVQTRGRAMLAHTHGQPATPTTLGKELAVFVYRWDRQLAQVQGVELLGKFSGATGNFNAHVAAFPDAPWLEIARAFVERLGLCFNPLTTQIEPHDYLAELFHALIRFHTIGLDFARDAWQYISLGYFRQRAVAGEVGSSTMPHKVNPIDFENAEANLGLANALLDHLATKLPVSRLQRDLTDSSALRNMGVALGHSVVALQSLRRGLDRLAVDDAALDRDLDGAWEVLAEPIQTVLRKLGAENGYELMKEHTRGAEITRDDMRRLVDALDLPAEDRARLRALTPAAYVGLAERLVDQVADGGAGAPAP